MSYSAQTVEPYKPQRVVIVFKKGIPASSATLGYYGTIVRVIGDTVARHSTEPHLWIYRVFVPYFQEFYDLEARDLCVTDCFDPTELPAEPPCEIRFASEVGEDNSEFHGAYHLPSRERDYFRFQKCDQSHPSYQLRLPIGERHATLYYNVPANDRLDRDYVLHAIGQILGIGEWRKSVT